MSTHNLNDDTKGAFRVTLRAVAKPGLALSCDGWRPKPLHGRRSNVQTTQRQRRGRPPPTPSPDSRSSRDGWLPKPQHARRPRVLAHRLCAYHPIACVRTAHPVKLSKMACKRAQQRWSGLQPALTHIAKQVRARLGDALWADFVTNAYRCNPGTSVVDHPDPDNNKIGDEGAKAIAGALSSGTAVLSKLGLRWNIHLYKRCKTRCEARAGAECGDRSSYVRG